MHVTGARYTLVFDGHCKVCNRFVDAVRRWDGGRRIDIIASQMAGVQARFSWIPPQAFSESIQLVRADDRKTWQGAAAIEEILNILPRGKRVAWMFRIPLVRPFAERFYRWFARNRYRLGCGDHCRT
jgi:predicted DCC family thiol-disulfide oxidoreductase YuxK